MSEITVDAVIENIDTVTDFINDQLLEKGCGMRAQMQIDVAVDELFGNIANYAYGENVGKATVSVGFDDSENVKITFTDSGVPYNPLEKSDPDITLSAEEREIGGLGIFMVKKTMDDMLYSYTEGKNILTIIKKIK